MSDGTKIEWTDATWNVITGCSPVSPGCKHCFAMRLAGGRLRNHPSRKGLTVQTKAGPVWTGEVRFNEMWLGQPLHWRQPRRVFVVAHGDLCDCEVRQSWRTKIFGVMDAADWHLYQLLTKRAATALHIYGEMAPRPNWWIGVSIEDQKRADLRRPLMRRLAAMGWNVWVSYEPALGPVDWTGWDFIKAMVSGGESGPNARPTHPNWHRGTRDWCAARGIPYGFKQWGEWKPVSLMTEAEVNSCYRTRRLARPGQDQEVLDEVYGRHCIVKTTVLHHDGRCHEPTAPNVFKANVAAMTMFCLGKGPAGRLLDGIEHNAFPGITS
jgi:protein gp37